MMTKLHERDVLEPSAESGDASGWAGSLAVIGSGPTGLYVLWHVLERAERGERVADSVRVFERMDRAGVGMPYHPSTTDRFNRCNISSEELPPLGVGFAEWLRGLNDAALAEFGIEREAVSEGATYGRLALGRYFADRFGAVCEGLRAAGVAVRVSTDCGVADVVDDAAAGEVTVVTEHGERAAFGRVVIATGHAWLGEDRAASGYFASPWPIQKVLPNDGERFGYTIGLLGASLSAFDVAASLAYRHGRFVEKGGLRYELDAEAGGFKLVMHSSNGWLPQLQYEQREPFRAVYRHVSRERLEGLRDEAGWLRLSVFWSEVARPALMKAFIRDGRGDMVARLQEESFDFAAFAECLGDEHDGDDAFSVMRAELPEARASLADDRPIHWKEVFDDLMYTLNFHAEWLPAEDHRQWRKEVMPFLLNVIAAMPLHSARMLLALESAGVLELVAGRVEVLGQDEGGTRISIEHEGQAQERTYRRFVDCTGQRCVEWGDYPFRSLVEGGVVRPAVARFADTELAAAWQSEDAEGAGAEVAEVNGEKVLNLGGIDVDAAYRVVGRDGGASDRVLDVAFPHTLGVRPYSYGLQACDETARLAVAAWGIPVERAAT